MNVHYRVHNSLPHVPVVSQINSAQAISLSYLFDRCPPTPKSSNYLPRSMSKGSIWRSLWGPNWIFTHNDSRTVGQKQRSSTYLFLPSQAPRLPPRHWTHVPAVPFQNHTPVFGSGVADHRKIFSRTRRRAQPTTRRNIFWLFTVQQIVIFPEHTVCVSVYPSDCHNKPSLFRHAEFTDCPFSSRHVVFSVTYEQDLYVQRRIISVFKG